MTADVSTLRPPREQAADTLIGTLFELNEPGETWTHGFDYERDMVLSPVDVPACHDLGLDPRTPQSLKAFASSYPQAFAVDVDCLFRPDETWRAMLTAEVQKGLERRLSAKLAYEWWTGTLTTAAGTDSPFLADVSADLLLHVSGALTPWVVGTTVATDVTDLAVSKLGRIVQLSSAIVGGEKLMIHAPIEVVAEWCENYRVVRNKAGKLVTQVGQHYVVTDAGYPNTGPANASAVSGKAWVFVTGACAVRRTPIEVMPSSALEGLDRSNNRITFTAQARGSVVDNSVIRAAFRVTL